MTGEDTGRAILLSPAALGVLESFLSERTDSPFAAPPPERGSYVRRAALDGLRSRGLVRVEASTLQPGEELVGLVTIADAAEEALSVTIAGAEQASVTWLRSSAAALEQRWVPEFASYAVQAIAPAAAVRRAIELATSPAPEVASEPVPPADDDSELPDLGADARLISVERRRWRRRDERIEGLRLEWVDGGATGRFLVDRTTPGAPVLRPITDDELLRSLDDVAAPTQEWSA